MMTYENKIEEFLNQKREDIENWFNKYSHYQKIGMLASAVIIGLVAFIISIATGFIIWLLGAACGTIGVIMILWSKEEDDLGLGFGGAVVCVMSILLFVMWYALA